ncbi:hypothetical protein GGS23DRAFT_18459 [Durotheca rogersii]|uniref:uncharacterized protein n=1 Tax=Durotheca rogersii TaxID=419775 RepID=UPI00221E85EA|nr:uncharacterized protein GGS23DRAFT_18459 [Durotheca rogersii]KAI5868210.1 hypothetical protein GGS23DRAFT_18459 [Durotheca rogersii]
MGGSVGLLPFYCGWVIVCVSCQTLRLPQFLREGAKGEGGGLHQKAGKRATDTLRLATHTQQHTRTHSGRLILVASCWGGEGGGV